MGYARRMRATRTPGEFIPEKAAKEGYRAVIRNIPLCQSHSATYREDANQPNLIDKSKG